MKVSKRVRQSYWDVLSDVGGFHDGICLLIGLIMGPASASHFQSDLVRGNSTDAANSSVLTSNKIILAKSLNDENETNVL